MINFEGRTSSGASKNWDAVGVDRPEGGSLVLELGFNGVDNLASRDFRTPERMATPIVPHPRTVKLYPISVLEVCVW